MTAEQLTNPRSNVLTACPERSEGFKRSNAPTLHSSILPTFNIQPSNIQPETFVPETNAFVPKTTNQEHTPITSNCQRKQAFMATQNTRKVFVPGKKILKFFLLKNPVCVSHPPSPVSRPQHRPRSIGSLQPKRSSATFQLSTDCI
jgi:hypothetical protein